MLKGAALLIWCGRCGAHRNMIIKNGRLTIWEVGGEARWDKIDNLFFFRVLKNRDEGSSRIF